MATGDRIAQVGRAVEAQGAEESGGVEAEEFVAIGHAPGVFLGGFGLDGVAVFLEFRDCFGGVLDF